MATRPAILTDVRQGVKPRRLRLLAPLRYLAIYNPEKRKYDILLPASFAIAGWLIYNLLDPRPPLFGDTGLLKIVRDMLIMAVPFMVGALAAVAMGAPGPYLDRRPPGVNLSLNGELLTLRQFTCYLLGYLSFIGLVTLGLAVIADLVRAPLLHMVGYDRRTLQALHIVGSLGLSCLLSALSVTTFWALYFLTDVVNKPGNVAPHSHN